MLVFIRTNIIFFLFLLKHKSWIHIRATSLMCCFRAKIRKIYTPENPNFTPKMGDVKGSILHVHYYDELDDTHKARFLNISLIGQAMKKQIRNILQFVLLL